MDFQKLSTHFIKLNLCYITLNFHSLHYTEPPLHYTPSSLYLVNIIFLYIALNWLMLGHCFCSSLKLFHSFTPAIVTQNLAVVSRPAPLPGLLPPCKLSSIFRCFTERGIRDNTQPPALLCALSSTRPFRTITHFYVSVNDQMKDNVNYCIISTFINRITDTELLYEYKVMSTIGRVK